VWRRFCHRKVHYVVAFDLFIRSDGLTRMVFIVIMVSGWKRGDCNVRYYLYITCRLLITCLSLSLHISNYLIIYTIILLFVILMHGALFCFFCSGIFIRSVRFHFVNFFTKFHWFSWCVLLFMTYIFSVVRFCLFNFLEYFLCLSIEVYYL
jgi:hypothetical protein